MFSKRDRRGRLRGITPAIATMILISGTIVLALVVGAFTYGFLGANVDRVTLSFARLSSGVTSDNSTTTSTASLSLSLKNPGRSLNITSITLSGNGLSSSITVWSITPDSQPGNNFLAQGHDVISGGNVSSFVLYPVQSPPATITIGETYGYYIVFVDGQSISGELIAQ